MKRVKIVTVIDNYGDEKFIVKHSVRFLFITIWHSVTWKNTDEPFFFDTYADAFTRAEDILNNANPRRQRVVTKTNVEEITV
jgi:hypothetical protein